MYASTVATSSINCSATAARELTNETQAVTFAPFTDEMTIVT